MCRPSTSLSPWGRGQGRLRRLLNITSGPRSWGGGGGSRQVVVSKKRVTGQKRGREPAGDRPRDRCAWSPAAPRCGARHGAPLLEGAGHRALGPAPPPPSRPAAEAARALGAPGGRGAPRSSLWQPPNGALRKRRGREKGAAGSRPGSERLSGTRTRSWPAGGRLPRSCQSPASAPRQGGGVSAGLLPPAQRAGRARLPHPPHPTLSCGLSSCVVSRLPRPLTATPQAPTPTQQEPCTEGGRGRDQRGVPETRRRSASG